MKNVWDEIRRAFAEQPEFAGIVYFFYFMFLILVAIFTGLGVFS